YRVSFLFVRRPLAPTPFPYTTLFRSLSELPSRLRLPQHQREPRAVEGRPGAPGDQLGRGPEPGAARRRRRVRPAHGARHGAHEAVAAPRGAVEALLQARPRPRAEAHGRRGPREW